MKKLYLAPSARRERTVLYCDTKTRSGLGREFFDEVRDLLRRIVHEAHTFPKWRDDRPYRKAVMTKRFSVCHLLRGA